MLELTSFRSIIDLWSSRETMAKDIGAGDGDVARGARMVSKWWQRDAIPSEWWETILGTAVAISAGVTARLLTSLDARPSAEPVENAEARP